MSSPLDAVPRLQVLVFAYELIANDLLVNDEDGSTRRISSVAGTATVTATFDDGTTEAFPRRTFLTVYRDRSALPPPFWTIPPFIVA